MNPWWNLSFASGKEIEQLVGNLSVDGGGQEIIEYE